MATSQNGFPVYMSASGLTDFKWVTGKTKPGDVTTVLDYVCSRFNAEVEKINKAWSWGYNYRAIRGQSTGFSNHASATAVDLNAPVHPLAKSGTFSAKQVAAIHKIIADCGGVVRWGGDYNGRKDEMHFEINASAAKVAALAAKIKGGKVAKVPAPWKPSGSTVSLSGVQEQFQIAQGLKPGKKVARNNGVGLIQAKLGLTVDGYCGAKTVAAWKAFEAKHGGTGRQATPDEVSIPKIGLKVTK